MKRLLLVAALLFPPACYAVDVAGYKVTRHDGKIVFAESYETVGPFHRVRDFKNNTTLHHVKDVASIEPLRWSDLRESRELASTDGSEWEKPTLFAPRLNYRTSARTVARHDEPPGEGVCGALREDGRFCQTPVEGGGYCPIHAKKFAAAPDATPDNGGNSPSIASLPPATARDTGISATRQQELERTLELRRAYRARSRAAYAARQAQLDADAALVQQEAQIAYAARSSYRSSSRGGYYTGPRQPPGYYAGGIGSSHAGGHYVNPNTGNHYQQRR